LVSVQLAPAVTREIVGDAKSAAGNAVETTAAEDTPPDRGAGAATRGAGMV
jgi:hypothetical protein